MIKNAKIPARKIKDGKKLRSRRPRSGRPRGAKRPVAPALIKKYKQKYKNKNKK